MERKRLRLEGYDYTNQGGYFITLCTKDRRPVLGTVVGADDYIGPHTRLSEYGRVAERYVQGMQGVDQYVIMPNHIHIIVLISSEVDGPMWSSAPTSVSQRIKTLKTLITKEIGAGIFQRSFHDHIIRSEADYLRIAAYIRDNPAKWTEDQYYVP
ncbi:transposase [Evtepia sp.]|uniref:transposase n=1 Tax=Evtepia sp. TaxID=2773933 RepID=UPI003F144B58